MASRASKKKSSVLPVNVVEHKVTPPKVDKGAPIVKKPRLGTTGAKKRDIPKGVWTKCPRCGAMNFDQVLERSLNVCPNCDAHLSISPAKRIESLVDEGSFEEMDRNLRSKDVLNFTGVSSYEDKLQSYYKKTGDLDAVVTGIGSMSSRRVGLGVMNFSFLGGSMGAVVGEKLTRLIEKCTAESIPVIIISSSGGARMYEGMFSLMQLAKTSAALACHSEKKLPYISVLTNPTTAGVMASYASLGDLIISEPGAMIGFAGPRVIRDTTQAELPPGFQTAEFLMSHGFLDSIVHRERMKEFLTRAIEFLGKHCKRDLPASDDS